MMRAEHLNVRFGDKIVLDDFSIEVPDTGVTVLWGASGCGKSTLLRVLWDVWGGGFLFQEDRLLPWFPIEKQMGDPTRWLPFVELEGEGGALPSELSGGMARRAALARCLDLGGDLLLLDEPFAGVDTQRAQRLLDRVRGLGKPVILAGHEPWLLDCADRVVKLDGPPLKTL